jgi:hypothetical protein
LLDRQLGAGIGSAHHFASSMKLAAADLDQESPLLAGLVRNFADKVDDYAEDFQGQTVEEITQTASDFARRQPALVFGLAALAGFVLFRAMKSAPDLEAPPIQPGPEDGPGQVSKQNRDSGPRHG